MALVKFHWFGINWHGFNQSECRNCCLYIIIQKIAPQAKSGKYFQIWFFPRFGEKNGGVLSMRMQVILDLSFARPRSAPIWAGRKESSGTGLLVTSSNNMQYCLTMLDSTMLDDVGSVWPGLYDIWELLTSIVYASENLKTFVDLSRCSDRGSSLVYVMTWFSNAKKITMVNVCQ